VDSAVEKTAPKFLFCQTDLLPFVGLGLTSDAYIVVPADAIDDPTDEIETIDGKSWNRIFKISSNTIKFDTTFSDLKGFINCHLGLLF
jgi:hypothetical protein